MKTNKKLYSVALGAASLILFLILVSFMVLSATARNASPIINETQITTNASDQYYPNIYEDKVVWLGFWNEKWAIYLYNLSTSTKTPIPINGTSPYVPVIYGDRIVWGDSILINANTTGYSLPVIYMYDLSTSKETQITTTNEAAMSPAIYGDKIVWMGSRNAGGGNYLDPALDWDIYMYNLSTFKETPITTNKSLQMRPAIYGDRIIWMDNRNGGSKDWLFPSGNWDIYMYNLSTSTETQITTNESLQMYPAIFGDNIVWIDSRNGNGEIYVYNLTTSNGISISNVSWKYDHPSIYGNRIVWTDFRNGKWEIFMHDLSTSRETQITTNSSSSQKPSNPAIYENKIVWQPNFSNEPNGNADIYMYTVPGADTESNPDKQSESEKNKSIPGFKISYVIIGLLGVFIYMRR
jgi:beta propeller repeat protein